MANDRSPLVTKAETGCRRAKGPVHVLRHTGSETAYRIKDFSPYPHVAASRVSLDADVSLEIETEDQFPRFNGGRPGRISRGRDDTSPSNVVRPKRSHSILDPIRLRVAVAVKKREDLTMSSCRTGVPRWACPLNGCVHDVVAGRYPSHSLEAAFRIIINYDDFHTVSWPGLTMQAGDANG
jgi:hypothetical protein